MSFATNYYVDGLQKKQDYNVNQLIFESFKKIGVFWELRDENVAGLNKQQFIELIKAKAYDGKKEISPEQFNEMQEQIKCVNDFWKSIPSVKLTTKLHHAKEPYPLSFEKFVPKELFTMLERFESEIAPIQEALNNDWDNPELQARLSYLQDRKYQYVAQVKITYLNSLTPKQREVIFKKIKDSQLAYNQDQIAELEAAKARYMEALEALKAWKPEADYQPLKDFVVEQVKTGITHLRPASHVRAVEELKDMNAEQFFQKEHAELMNYYKRVTADLAKAEKSTN